VLTFLTPDAFLHAVAPAPSPESGKSRRLRQLDRELADEDHQSGGASVADGKE
jgi:hypothetical protein